MPDETTTPQDTDEATDAAVAEETPDETAASDPLTAARREAASYRRRLRETETERDEAHQRAQAAQRAEAERLAQGADLTGRDAHHARVMARGADLWAAGVNLDELVGDDGRVDPAAVNAATRQVLTDHPHWGQRLVRPQVGPGLLAHEAGLTVTDDAEPGQTPQEIANKGLAQRLGKLNKTDGIKL
jgi:hypothetical protein